MGVTGVDSTGVNANIVNSKQTTITSDQFLLLFVEQLKNQDPLEPMDNTEYITQLAQISLLEQASGLTTMMGQLLSINADTNDQINNLVNQSNQNLLVNYSNLIGKVGYWINSDGVELNGDIKGIIQKEHQFYALIDNKEIRVSDIYKVDLGL